eukprot:6193429-Pleurochrysis_carterae.AAC.1
MAKYRKGPLDFYFCSAAHRSVYLDAVCAIGGRLEGLDIRGGNAYRIVDRGWIKASVMKTLCGWVFHILKKDTWVIIPY